MTSTLTPAWMSVNGLIDLPRTTLPPLDAVAAADQLQILGVIARYAWSYDERDLEVMKDTFTEDAVFDSNVRTEYVAEPLRGRDAIAARMREFMDGQEDQRRHHITNALVLGQTDDSAHVMAFLLLTAATDAGVRLVTTGVYDVRLRKEAGRWRMEHVLAGFDAPF